MENPKPNQTKTPLQEIANAPEIVKAFGRSYEIKKFTLGPMTQALEHVGVIGFVIQMIQELPKDASGKVTATPNEMLAVATRAISVMGPSVFGLISIATKEPPEWLEEQDAMDGLRIFAKVVEKNLDFFSQKNIDEMTGIFAKLQAPTLKAGGAT